MQESREILSQACCKQQNAEEQSNHRPLSLAQLVTCNNLYFTDRS